MAAELFHSSGKIYVKFLAVFLTIVLLPLLILGGTNLFGFSKLVRNEVVAYNEQLLQSSARNMDLHLRELRNYIARMSLISWSLESDYYAENSITDNFLGLRATSEAVIDAFVYFPAASRVVNCDGLNEAAFYFNKVLRLSAEDGADLAAMLQQKQSFSLSKEIFVDVGDVGRASVILLNSYPSFTVPATGMIGIVLDVGEIIAMANLAEDGASSAALCICEVDGSILAASDPMWLAYENAGVLKEQLARSDSRRFLSYLDKSYVVSTFSSEVFPLTYVMIKNAGQITSVADSIRSVTGMLTVVLILLGLFFGYILSKNFYKPIYQLMNVAIDADDTQKYSVDDRLDEFEIISDYIERLQEKSRRIEGERAQNADLIQEYYAQRLLLGIAATDYNGSRRHVMEKFTHGIFYSVILYVAYDEIGHEEYTTRMSEISRAVHAALSGRQDASYVVTSVAMDRLSLIINCDSFDVLSELVALLSKTVAAANTQREFKYGIGVGDAVETLDRISESYKQAQTALKHRTAISREQTVYYQNLRDVDLRDAYIYYPLNAEKSIVYNLVQGDVREVIKITDNLIAKNDLACATVRKMEFFYQQIVIAARKAILISNLPDADKFNLLMSLSDPKDTDSPAHMKSAVYDCFTRIANAISQGKNGKKNGLANQMIEYVSRNYASSISLDILADEFGFSAKYLSAYFKSSTGMNYVDYLNSVRLDNAKRLIVEQPNMKIADIGEAVGFINPSTFIASFRKSEGVTPGTYRARYPAK